MKYTTNTNTKEAKKMKIYFLFVQDDDTREGIAIYASTEYVLCENEMQACRNRGVQREMWIKECDFSQVKEISLL